MIEFDGAKIYFIEDVAKLVGKSIRTVRRDMDAGLIKGTKINGGYIFTESEMKEYKDKKDMDKITDSFIVNYVDGRRPDEPFIKVHDDFLFSTHFNTSEKSVFIALKSCATTVENEQGETGEVTITLDDLSKAAGIPRSTANRAIRGLYKKGAIDIKNNGHKKANTYTIYDYEDVWNGNRKRGNNEQ